MTEYGDTGYASGGYPAREGRDPGRGGTVYGGGAVYRGGAVYGVGARHTGDEGSPSGGHGGSDTTYDSIRGRVWRPTRGPRAEEAPRATDPGYGAPERGWRTSDGGYRSTEGGWRAPYRPYDTGEFLRDQHPDTGPPSTGEIARYRSGGTGDIGRYSAAPGARGVEGGPGTRQPPTSSGGYPAPPRRRALDAGGRRDDSADLYEYDPLTLGGGESPAMRYDRAAESYTADAAPGEAPLGGPDLRRTPRPGGPRTDRYEARAIEAPAVARHYDQPPARRPPTRPQQRFEGTYPARSVRNPRNVVPARGRPAPASGEDEETPGFLHTALVTTAWYTIPLLLYTMYVLTLDGSAEAGDGASARENALNGLLGGMPRVGVALVTSLAVALLIRLISKGWRAATIGFASAVVGAGVATVIFTALQG